MILAAENTNPLIPEPAEVVVGTIAFFIVFFLLGKLMLPKIVKALDERTDAIQGGLERAELAQEEANAKLAEYNAQLAEAREEAARLRQEARVQHQTIVDAAAADAQAKADEIIARAREVIAAERDQAVRAIQSQVGRLAVDLAGRVVGESLEDEALRRRTVERFLAELESGAIAVGGAVSGGAGQ